MKYVRTTNQLADFLLTKGLFIHHIPVEFIVVFVANHTTLGIKWCPQFFSQTFLLLSFRKAPSDVSGDDTAQEHGANMESVRNKSIAIRLRYGKSRDFGTIEQLWVSVYSRQEESFCRHALSSESGGKPLACWYFISNVRKTQNLWDNLSFRRRTVENTWCSSSRLLRFRLLYGKRSDARTRSQVHPKMEWLSRAIQGVCKENWWRKGSVRIPHISWQKDVRDRERTVEWTWRDQGEDGQYSLQKLLLIEFYLREWWTKFGFLHRNRKEVR